MVYALMLLLYLTAAPLDTTVEEIREYPSVHEEAVREHGTEPVHDVVTTDTSGDSELNKTVFGFLPYWVNQAWLHYDLISVLAVFAVEMGSDGSVTNYHGFPSSFATAMDQAHANGNTVVVTVTNFSGSQIHSILTTNRTEAIATMVDLVNNSVADGVSVDFENLQAADSDNFVTFMEDLRTALPNAHISACTPAVDWGGAYDYSALAESCDALMMMCYAFAGAWSSTAGPNAPLKGWGSSPESASNMAWALCDYVRYAPEVHEKLVVGLPYYGHQWKTDGPSAHSPATDCSTLFYVTLASRAESYGALWDDESLTPWYHFYSGGWNQGWYDDPQSLGLKYDMINMAGMQGIGIWALGYDGDRPELWQQLETSFGSSPPNDFVTDNLEDCCILHGPSSYWHPYIGAGQYHTFFYTGSTASGPDVNWIQWNFHLPDSSGTYYLEAYVPPTGTASVTYNVFHGTGEDSVTVDQSVFADQWVSLGGPYDADGGLYVTLGDNTGTSGNRIVVDAVRFIDSSGIETASGALPGLFSVSSSPSSCFTVCSPYAGILRLYDVYGRLVAQSRLEAGGSWFWNGEAPSGVYVLLMESGSRVSAQRIVLVK